MDQLICVCLDPDFHHGSGVCLKCGGGIVCRGCGRLPCECTLMESEIERIRKEIAEMAMVAGVEESMEPVPGTDLFRKVHVPKN